MNLKKIITISVSALMLAGVGALASSHLVSANQPAQYIRYTNGRYNYYYPARLNSKVDGQWAFNINKKYRITGHAKKLAKRYRYNAGAQIIDPRYGHRASVAYKNHQKYLLVEDFMNDRNYSLLSSQQISDNYKGREAPGFGYINAKDFMKHRHYNKKHLRALHHKRAVKRANHRRHARKLHRSKR